MTPHCLLRKQLGLYTPYTGAPGRGHLGQERGQCRSPPCASTLKASGWRLRVCTSNSSNPVHQKRRCLSLFPARGQLTCYIL